MFQVLTWSPGFGPSPPTPHPRQIRIQLYKSDQVFKVSFWPRGFWVNLHHGKCYIWFEPWTHCDETFSSIRFNTETLDSPALINIGLNVWFVRLKEDSKTLPVGFSWKLSDVVRLHSEAEMDEDEGKRCKGGAGFSPGGRKPAEEPAGSAGSRRAPPVPGRPSPLWSIIHIEHN